MPIEKECAICGTRFSVKANRANTAKTCSNACRGKLQARRYAAERLTKTCEKCGKEFQVKPYRSQVRFCSKQCRHESATKALECQMCGEPFEVYTSSRADAQYCSKACADKAKRGGLDRVEKICASCGEGYDVSPYQAYISRYCSKQCADKGKETRVKRTCEYCKQKYFAIGSRADTARFCSEECKWRFVTGDLEWKSPEGVNREGYRRRGSNSYEHRELMLKWLIEEDPEHHFIVYDDAGKAYLSSMVEVHHIDRNRLNNDRGNLLAVTSMAHSRIHHKRQKPKPWECWPPNPTMF